MLFLHRQKKKKQQHYNHTLHGLSIKTSLAVDEKK